MAIVLANCPGCGRLIEVDAVILTGNDETVWRKVRFLHKPGERINVQTVADMAGVSHVTVYNILKRLIFLKLVHRQRVKRYYHYYVASTATQKLKISA